MLVTGIITLISETETGKSMSTGRDWWSRDVIIESEEADGRKNTFAARAFGRDICNTLNQFMEGDKVTIDLAFRSSARTYDKNGKQMVFRSTTVDVVSVQTVELRGF